MGVISRSNNENSYIKSLYNNQQKHFSMLTQTFAWKPKIVLSICDHACGWCLLNGFGWNAPFSNIINVGSEPRKAQRYREAFP